MALGVIVVAAWLAVHGARRARTGARARRVGGVRLRRIDRFAHEADPALGRAVGGATLAAVWLGGWVVTPIGPALGWLAWWLRSRGTAVARTRLRDAQVPEAMRAIAAGVRAGGNLRLALEAAGAELPMPIAEPIRRCGSRCELGVSFDDALDGLERELGSVVGARLTETLRVGAVAGAALPAILGRAADEIDEAQRLQRDRRAASAQVRASALVISAMPAAFLALAGPAARGQARVLFMEPIGWVLLLLGVGLNALGWTWMCRLGGGAVP